MVLKTLSDSYGRLSNGLDWVAKRRRRAYRPPQSLPKGYLTCTLVWHQRLIVSLTCISTHRTLVVHSHGHLCCSSRYRAHTEWRRGILATFTRHGARVRSVVGFFSLLNVLNSSKGGRPLR